MKTILIATDFSPAATNALLYGAGLIKHLDLNVILVHAVTPPLGRYDTLTPKAVLDEVKRASRHILNENKHVLIDHIGYDPGIKMEVEIGRADEVIQAAAYKYKADLVVIGIIGESGTEKRKSIGSNTLKLARALDAPLMVIPEHVEYRNIHKLSFACDPEKIEEEAFRYIIKTFCQAFNARLEVVHIKTALAKPINVLLAESTIEQMIEKTAHTIVTVSDNDPANALKNYFANHKTDLIIMNPKEHPLFERLFHQSVSHELVFALNMPMLIIHS
jgi:nucleotide-binding universal stress UspA family protein